jgi:hypothetical protein
MHVHAHHQRAASATNKATIGVSVELSDQNLIKFDHVGEELSYGEPRAFGWGGPASDLARIVIQHVLSHKSAPPEQD